MYSSTAGQAALGQRGPCEGLMGSTGHQAALVAGAGRWRQPPVAGALATNPRLFLSVPSAHSPAGTS